MPPTFVMTSSKGAAPAYHQATEAAAKITADNTTRTIPTLPRYVGRRLMRLPIGTVPKGVSISIPPPESGAMPI